MNVSFKFLQQQNKMEHRSSNAAGGYKNSLAKVTTEVLIFQKNLQSSLLVISARHLLDKAYKKMTSLLHLSMYFLTRTLHPA